MTTTPRSGRKMTQADRKYLLWIGARERAARREAYRAVKLALPMVDSQQRRAILAAIRAEG